MADAKEKAANAASQEMLEHAKSCEIDTAWERLEAMDPQCGFGELGICCRNCSMGPCRVDPFGEGPQRGVCGADANTIAARNLVRMIAGGAAAHSDHGRDVAEALLDAASNPDSDYEVKDEIRLHQVARTLQVETEGRDTLEIAREVAETALQQFGQQEGELFTALQAPEARIERWREAGIMPRGIDREIVEIMHRTHIGVDADYENLMKQGMRAALSDGWGGSMLATDLQDILFGGPRPIRGKTNLGVLDPGKVNIVVHGHEPALSEMIVEAVREQELIEEAKAAGAEGINLVGMCCTANEILMRQGIAAAGTFLQQELGVMTGAVDAMIVDVQCWMPALVELCDTFFHTELLTTSPKGKVRGARHVEFHEDRALEIARELVHTGIEAFKARRPEKVHIPEDQMDLIAGFTADYVFEMLGGRFRPSYRPLNDGIITGRLRGVAGVVGCENPKVSEGYNHVEMIKELIKNDVLVVSTGCSALAAAREGLMTPESARKMAGRGLQEICEAVGIPPVLHVGSCVDNSRILIACAQMVKEGGLGEDISDLPVAGAAPEWMSEKAVSIGWYVVASGIFTVFDRAFPCEGAPELYKFVTEDVEQMVGARWAFESDPIAAARLMMEHMDEKRAALKLQPMMYEPAEAAAG
jgi:carbon-monoxide dehydrogenase catalytic subunit